MWTLFKPLNNYFFNFIENNLNGFHQFNLRDRNATEPTSIYCFLRYDNKRARIITGQSIVPFYWNFAKQRTNNKMNKSLAMELNTYLNNFEKDVLTEFIKFNNENGRNPEPKEIKTIIEQKRFGVKVKNTIPKKFFDYWDYYVNNQKRTTSPKTGKLISSGTIQTYINAKEKLLQFQKQTKRSITFESIDLDFYYSFVEFLEDEGFSKNTIGKQIKILKGVLNDATANQVNKNLRFKSNKFNVMKEETTMIYLNLKELDLMIKLDLSENTTLQKVRDLFILLCFTGQRFQSLRDIVDPENRDQKFIRLKQGKTNTRLVIPILPEARAALNNLEPKDVITNGLFNRYIKEVGAMIPQLHTEIKTEITKGGKKIIKSIKKYELIASHTGRRSFATNFYSSGKIPIGQVMAITGHKKESTFFSYIRTSSEEHATKFLESLNK